MASKIKKARGPSLRSVSQSLWRMPRAMAIDVARKGAALITQAAQESFDAGETAYGDTRPLSPTGKKVSLVKTGRARLIALTFRSDGGTRIRSSIAEKYMGVLVGVYNILPIGAGGLLPRKWARLLKEQTERSGAEQAAAQLRRAA
jgi:hypothetical protein